jgi:hypothetical protein
MGFVVGSVGMSTSRLRPWIAMFWRRAAIELASPSWSRASR